MEKIRKKHGQKIRYGLVGAFNTGLDFALLFIFVGLGLDRIPANYLSTGISMIFSFFANRSFTFKHTGDQKKKQFALFIIVTVLGMWVLQPLVIWIVSAITDPFIENRAIHLFIAKLAATGASLVWNYVLYSRVVFKKNSTVS